MGFLLRRRLPQVALISRVRAHAVCGSDTATGPAKPLLSQFAGIQGVEKGSRDFPFQTFEKTPPDSGRSLVPRLPNLGFHCRDPATWAGLLAFRLDPAVRAAGVFLGSIAFLEGGAGPRKGKSSPLHKSMGGASRIRTSRPPDFASCFPVTTPGCAAAATARRLRIMSLERFFDLIPGPILWDGLDCRARFTRAKSIR